MAQLLRIQSRKKISKTKNPDFLLMFYDQSIHERNRAQSWRRWEGRTKTVTDFFLNVPIFLGKVFDKNC